MNLATKAKSRLTAFAKLLINPRRTSYNKFFRSQNFNFKGYTNTNSGSWKGSNAFLFSLLMSYPAYTTYKAFCIEDDVIRAAKNRIDDGKTIHIGFKR